MPRRIVTGVDAGGKSVFVSDSEAPGTFVPGSGTMYDVWGVDGEFDAPNDGRVPSRGAHVRVKGRVGEVATFGGQSTWKT